MGGSVADFLQSEDFLLIAESEKSRKEQESDYVKSNEPAQWASDIKREEGWIVEYETEPALASLRPNLCGMCK